MLTFAEYVNEHFDGVLKASSHPVGLDACALEAVSQYRGLPWDESPEAVGMPDLRPLNDARWSSDKERTAALVPVVEAYLRWPTLTEGQQSGIIQRIALETIRRILPPALRVAHIPEARIQRCEAAESLAAAAYAAATARAAADAAARASAAAYAAATARAAADAAAYAAAAARAAADAAAYAAAAATRAAADAAVYAAAAAAYAAADADADADADAVLRRACGIWIEAAQAVPA